MEESLKKNFNKFVKYLVNYVHRDGINEFVNWLTTTDIATAPASTKYHMSVPGGLVQHSLNVFYRLIKIINMEYPDQEECPYSKETLALVSLLHDISKVNFFEVSTRNVKNPETGLWEQHPYYATREENNRLIFGCHEENSVYILQKFFKLTYDEAMAIRWHSGACYSNDSRSVGDSMNAFRHCNLAIYLNMADTLASCIDEEPDVVNFDFFNDKSKQTEEESTDEQESTDSTEETF